MLDINKRVYNHTPGPCRVVDGISDGAAGLEIISELGLVFISTGLAGAYGNTTSRPGLAVFQLQKEMAKHEVKPIKIEGERFNQNEFIPLGLSSYYSKGRISLYVVNTHPNRQCVEIFTYHKEKNLLFYRKSVCDPRFSSISDIVVIGADRFFVSNLAYMSRGYLQTAELMMQSSFGALYFFDGRNVSLQESQLSSPSALAIDRRRQLIYAGSMLNENIRVYKLERDFSLTFRTQISLLSSPAGMHVDEETGDIWVALHPVLYQAFLVTLSPNDERIRSPSQVLRVRMQEDGVSWVITEPYANDGATISASNAVVYDKEHLVVGSMFSRLLHCDVLNPSIT
nr:Arylesterase domain containing protein [Haemonchus contortus]